MNEEQETIALWCKEQEIKALQTAKQGTDEHYIYWEAKAQAFSQVWEFIVFKGSSVSAGIHPLKYNQENERYSKMLEEKNERDN